MRTFIDLSGSVELLPYAPHLAAHAAGLGLEEEYKQRVEYHSFLIPDSRPPHSVCYLRQILGMLKDNERRGRITTVRWPGGVGRTGLVVGCWFVGSGSVEDGAAELHFISKEWKSFSQRPETDGQCDFVWFERLQGFLVVPT